MDRRALLVPVIAALAVAVYFAARSPGSGPGRAGESRVTGGCSRSAGPEGDLAGKGGARVPGKTVRDQTLRDATRERLRERLGERFPAARPARATPRAARSSAPATAPAAAAPPEGAEGGPRIEKKYIQERVREDFFPLAKQCYEDALKRTPGIAGKIALHFTIVGDEKIGGIVEDASVGEESTLHDEEFETCMSESMMTMTFPPPRGGGTVTVMYPIDFSPGDEDEGDAGASKQGSDAGAPGQGHDAGGGR
jgi:hypothetical protein